MQFGALSACGGFAVTVSALTLGLRLRFRGLRLRLESRVSRALCSALWLKHASSVLQVSQLHCILVINLDQEGKGLLLQKGRRPAGPHAGANSSRWLPSPGFVQHWFAALFITVSWCAALTSFYLVPNYFFQH